MNETEWLDYFETINNRKPSEEEIQQAKANGEFVTSEPVAENSQPQVQVSGPVTGQGTPVVAPKKVYIKTYKEFLKETVHYKVNADKINVLTYDKKGKLSEEKVFKRLTKEEEKKLDYEYERDVRADKKLFHS